MCTAYVIQRHTYILGYPRPTLARDFAMQVVSPPNEKSSHAAISRMRSHTKRREVGVGRGDRGASDVRATDNASRAQTVNVPVHPPPPASHDDLVPAPPHCTVLPVGTPE
ncbi:hypothetical protein EVAR_51670_1 [Eumeta japonica]|uniref:Uncharacterized protein n=1 Tax=Eumeta variegata TaxID=151549 RepID=A0A4C1YI00_EUMVA|nr:hypothetical protein EVAR_51670_1 [Eumeta japonica]